MSFTHAILDSFVTGLNEAGHQCEIVDHIYFHSILAVDNDTRKKYLEIAYLKGKNL
jgi:hypothetical protein